MGSRPWVLPGDGSPPELYGRNGAPGDVGSHHWPQRRWVSLCKGAFPESGSERGGAGLCCSAQRQGTGESFRESYQARTEGTKAMSWGAPGSPAAPTPP